SVTVPFNPPVETETCADNSGANTQLEATNTRLATKSRVPRMVNRKDGRRIAPPVKAIGNEFVKCQPLCPRSELGSKPKGPPVDPPSIGLPTDTVQNPYVCVIGRDARALRGY